MRYAFDNQNKRIEVSQSGQIAICPDCGSNLRGRKGAFRPPHWTHISKIECDSWYEPITEWHLKWQNFFPEKNREISFWDEQKRVKHRADICLDNGLVIEVQHSSITPEEINQRESFYKKNRMIWLLDGSVLAKNSSIRYKFQRKQFALDIIIPSFIEGVMKYDMDDFRERVMNLTEYKCLMDYNDLIKNEIDNGCCIEFEFKNEKPFSDIRKNIHNEVRKLAYKLYGVIDGELVLKDFETHHISNSIDVYRNVMLEKKFWRSFIECIKFPIFFDNLPGLSNHLLYWYQENRIVYKETFIDKYLKYT